MWSDRYYKTTLDELPLPDLMGGDEERCHFAYLLDPNSGDLTQLAKFIEEYGKWGEYKGCPTHQMDDPAAILKLSRTVFEEIRAHPSIPTRVDIEGRPELAALSPRDRAYVATMILDPIETSPTGALADGAHRLCAFRNTTVGNADVLVAVLQH